MPESGNHYVSLDDGSKKEWLSHSRERWMLVGLFLVSVIAVTLLGSTLYFAYRPCPGNSDDRTSTSTTPSTTTAREYTTSKTSTTPSATTPRQYTTSKTSTTPKASTLTTSTTTFKTTQRIKTTTEQYSTSDQRFADKVIPTGANHPTSTTVSTSYPSTEPTPVDSTTAHATPEQFTVTDPSSTNAFDISPSTTPEILTTTENYLPKTKKSSSKNKHKSRTQTAAE